MQHILTAFMGLNSRENLMTFKESPIATYSDALEPCG
jgi:hypothetical protein